MRQNGNGENKQQNNISCPNSHRDDKNGIHPAHIYQNNSINQGQYKNLTQS